MKGISKYMKITYTKNGDYLLPNLILKNNPSTFFGRYGLLRLNYLKQHNKVLYQQLLAKDKLTNYLIDIDKTATERVEKIIVHLAEEKNVDEHLKATNQLKWVGLMNNFKSQAEEIVLSELIYD